MNNEEKMKNLFHRESLLSEKEQKKLVEEFPDDPMISDKNIRDIHAGLSKPNPDPNLQLAYDFNDSIIVRAELRFLSHDRKYPRYSSYLLAKDVKEQFGDKEGLKALKDLKEEIDSAIGYFTGMKSAYESGFESKPQPKESLKQLLHKIDAIEDGLFKDSNVYYVEKIMDDLDEVINESLENAEKIMKKITKTDDETTK